MIATQKDQFYSVFNELVISELISDLMNNLWSLYPVKIKCFLSVKNTKISIFTTVYTKEDKFAKCVDVSDEMNTAWDYFQANIFKDYIDNDLFVMSEKIANAFLE